MKQYSLSELCAVIQEVVENDLLERVMADETFSLTTEELNSLTDPSTFTGMAEHQCEKFLNEHVKPVLEKYKEYIGVKAEINV